MGAGDTLFSFQAIEGTPPSSTAAATPDRRGNDGHFVYDFADSPDQSLDFADVMPEHRDVSNNITVTVGFMMSSDLTNDVRIDVQFERHEIDVTDLDSAGFTAVQSDSQPVASALGELQMATIVLTHAQADSIAAGEDFRLRVTRDPDHADDDASGDMELKFVNAVETAP